jgi:hypothetical protein
MCTVSVVHDFGRNMPNDAWTSRGWSAFNDLLRAAATFDTVTGQPDCEDADKTDWVAHVEERLGIRGVRVE